MDEYAYLVIVLTWRADSGCSLRSDPSTSGRHSNTKAPQSVAILRGGEDTWKSASNHTALCFIKLYKIASLLENNINYYGFTKRQQRKNVILLSDISQSHNQ